MREDRPFAKIIQISFEAHIVTVVKNWLLDKQKFCFRNGVSRS